MRKVLVTVSLLLAMIMPVTALADELTLTENPPPIYVVKKGDTLWGIAGLYLQDPWRWPQIWEINPQLENPHLIYPGDQLYLVYVDGQPRLRVKRGSLSRTVKLTPRMRIEPLDTAIPVISLEQIGAWLSGHRIVVPGELESAPYVLAGAQRHILSSAGDLFYARGSFPENETGYGVFRRGDSYVDPVTEEILGHQAVDIGSATLLERHADGLAHLEVTRVTEEVRNGDRLLPNEARRITAAFAPHAPEEEINAFMIAVDGGVSQIGLLNIVALNKGEREGLEVGHVLATFQTGEVVRDHVLGTNVKMPDARAGLLMVFRTFEKMAYGIILKSDRPLSVMDRVGNP